jgi:hypothetical protein
MDWNQVIEQMGGGLSAVVIVAQAVALAWAVKKIFSRYEAQMEREREHSRELKETISAVQMLTRGAGQ